MWIWSYRRKFIKWFPMTRWFKRKPRGSAGARFKIEFGSWIFGSCLRISPKIARTVETEFNYKHYSLCFLKYAEFIHFSNRWCFCFSRGPRLCVLSKVLRQLHVTESKLIRKCEMSRRVLRIGRFNRQEMWHYLSVSVLALVNGWIFRKGLH